MSIHSLYEMSRRSFRTLDAAMNVTGQNISNVNTEGYSRRRLTLQADSPAIGGIHTRVSGGVSSGAGVSVADYARLRDNLVDRASWDARGALGSSQEEQRILSALEGIFPNSGAGSLHDLFNDFWNSWSDLANYPTDQGVKLTVRSRAESLASGLNRINGDLNTLRNETRDALASGVDEVNALLKEVAALNVTIRDAEMRGSADYESQDRRDQVVKQLAEFAPVKVQNRAEGYTVTINGMVAVQSDYVETLQLVETNNSVSVEFAGASIPYTTGGVNDGKLGAWLRSLSDTIPNTRAQLDQLAEALVTSINAAHSTLQDENGDPVVGDNFFHYNMDGLGNEYGITAADIRLSDEVLADASIIGASDYYTPGGESVAFAISEMRQTGLAGLQGETAEHFVINLMSDIGAKVKQASSKASAQTAVVDHLEAMGLAVSGVSIEEDMTNLIKFQQAFGAAARVLTTTEEMMDTLLTM